MRGENAPALLGTQYSGTDGIKLYQLTCNIERVLHHGEDWQDKVECRGEQREEQIGACKISQGKSY